MLKCKTFTSQYGYVDELFNKYIKEHNIHKDQIYMIKYIHDKEHIMILIYDDEEQLTFSTQDIQRLLNTPTEIPCYLNQSVVQ